MGDTEKGLRLTVTPSPSSCPDKLLMCRFGNRTVVYEHMEKEIPSLMIAVDGNVYITNLDQVEILGFVHAVAERILDLSPLLEKMEEYRKGD